MCHVVITTKKITTTFSIFLTKHNPLIRKEKLKIGKINDNFSNSNENIQDKESHP
jgi:hypothetical protein